MNAPGRQRPGISQGQVGPDELGQLRILEQGRNLDRCCRQGIAGLSQQPGRVGIGQRERLGQPVQRGAILLVPDRSKLSGFRGVARGDFFQPGFGPGSCYLGG